MHIASNAADDVATRWPRGERREGFYISRSPATTWTGTTRPRHHTVKNVRGVPLARGRSDVTSDRAYRRTLAAFQQVCLAIAYAHERGVYHRALDLSSIVLGGFGEVYVGGFSASPFEFLVREAE